MNSLQAVDAPLADMEEDGDEALFPDASPLVNMSAKGIVGSQQLSRQALDCQRESTLPRCWRAETSAALSEVEFQTRDFAIGNMSRDISIIPTDPPHLGQIKECNMGCPGAAQEKSLETVKRQGATSWIEGYQLVCKRYKEEQSIAKELTRKDNLSRLGSASTGSRVNSEDGQVNVAAFIPFSGSLSDPMVEDQLLGSLKFCDSSSSSLEGSLLYHAQASRNDNIAFNLTKDEIILQEQSVRMLEQNTHMSPVKYNKEGEAIIDNDNIASSCGRNFMPFILISKWHSDSKERNADTREKIIPTETFNDMPLPQQDEPDDDKAKGLSLTTFKGQISCAESSKYHVASLLLTTHSDSLPDYDSVASQSDLYGVEFGHLFALKSEEGIQQDKTFDTHRPEVHQRPDIASQCPRLSLRARKELWKRTQKIQHQISLQSADIFCAHTAEQNNGGQDVTKSKLGWTSNDVAIMGGYESSDDVQSVELILPSRRKRLHVSRVRIVAFFLKYTLFLLNFVFWVGSVAAIVIGGWVMRERGQLVRDPASFFLDPSAMLCLLGALTFLVAFCGCLGALRENIFLLRVFQGSMVAVLVLEAVLVLLVFAFYNIPSFRSQLKAGPEQVLHAAIHQYKDDPELGRWIDFIQTQVTPMSHGSVLKEQNSDKTNTDVL